MEAEERMLRQLQALKKLAELPLIKRVGARICQDRNEFIFVGFVERIAEEKIQIRVARAQLASSPGFGPGGFSPHIIWDYPYNWYLCE